jgi:hypothetical protein
MDKFVATRFDGEIVRLDKPILKSHIWLASSQRFYDSHRSDVETMWNWLGGEGNRRYNMLLRKYTEH